MSGKDHHPHLRNLFTDAAKDIDAVQAGKLGVQNADVWICIQAQLDGRLTITGFANELVIGIEPQDLNQHFPDGGLVFDNDEPFHENGVEI